MEIVIQSVWQRRPHRMTATWSALKLIYGLLFLFEMKASNRKS